MPNNLTKVNTRCSHVVRDFESEEKLGITFNSDKLGGIDFTKISKLTMCSAYEEAQAITFLKISYVKFSPKIRIF